MITTSTISTLAYNMYNKRQQYVQQKTADAA